MSTEKSVHQDLITRLYDAYNGRDLQALLALVDENVDWPDGDERLHGRTAVSRYWSQQWARIHTHDTVVGITDLGPDQAVVHISQVVRDLDGKVISTGQFEHTYRFENGLAKHMVLRKVEQTDTPPIVEKLYAGFNRRDIPAVLALLSEDVEWANGMNGGHEHGREAVRAYWTKQWAAIAPKVDPLFVTERDDGAIAIDVHQVVHDLDGKLLLDETVRHVFHIEDGLVTRFDIENAGGLADITH